MLNYPFSYLRGKCNNFIDTINPFNNLVYNKLSSHSIGARSLYLFIVVIYQFKCFFSDPELLHSKPYLSKIKKNILNCGCISIKFTQWIVSKLKGSDDNEKYSDVIEELEVLFDNCKYHDFKHTEDTFTDPYEGDYFFYVGIQVDWNGDGEYEWYSYFTNYPDWEAEYSEEDGLRLYE